MKKFHQKKYTNPRKQKYSALFIGKMSLQAILVGLFSYLWTQTDDSGINSFNVVFVVNCMLMEWFTTFVCDMKRSMLLFMLWCSAGLSFAFVTAVFFVNDGDELIYMLVLKK